MKKKSVMLALLLLSIVCKAQQSVLIHDLNTKLFLQDFSKYDQRTATFCAQVSELAYWKDAKLSKFIDSLRAVYPDDNFHYKLLDDHYGQHSNQALLLGTKKFMIVAFRGTEPTVFKDWFSDVKYWNYENSEGADERISFMPPGHGGFRTALMRLIIHKSLIEEVKAMIALCHGEDKLDEFPVYLTGHSLGAAISQMFIEPLKKAGFNFQGAYHFAPPLAVSCSVNKAMKEKYGAVVYDIVNYKDYVPRAGRNNVAHFGQFYRICNDGLLYKEAEAYVKFNGKEYLKEFKLHALASYLEAIRNNKNTIEAINLRSVGDFPCMELTKKRHLICD